MDLNVSVDERTVNNKFDLSNIANYNPDLNTVNNNIYKITDSLEKSLNKPILAKNKNKGKTATTNTTQPGKFTLDDLINSFVQDIETEIDDRMKNKDQSKKDENKDNRIEEEKNNFYMKNLRRKKFAFLQLNNDSKYLQKI